MTALKNNQSRPRRAATLPRLSRLHVCLRESGLTWTTIDHLVRSSIIPYLPAHTVFSSRVAVNRSSSQAIIAYPARVSLHGTLLVIQDEIPSASVIGILRLPGCYIRAVSPSLLSVSKHDTPGLLFSLSSNIPIHSLVDKLASLSSHPIPPSLSRFACLDPIAAGLDATVYLVRDLHTNEKFAMKVIKRDQCSQVALQRLLNQRAALEILRGIPFVVDLRHAFVTSQLFICLFEFCVTGDLFRYMRLRDAPLTSNEAAFLVAQLICAAKAVHRAGCRLRWLQAEDILIDSQGWIRLTQVERENDAYLTNQTKRILPPLASLHHGVAGHAKQDSNALKQLPTTTPIVGLMPNVQLESSSISPVVLPEQGPFPKSTSSLDRTLRSIGTLAHYALTMEFPYENETLVNSSSGNAAVSKMLIDPKARDFVSKMLQRNPMSLADARSHPWLHELPWDEIERKEGVSPLRSTKNPPGGELLDLGEVEVNKPSINPTTSTDTKQGLKIFTRRSRAKKEREKQFEEKEDVNPEQKPDQMEKKEHDEDWKVFGFSYSSKGPAILKVPYRSQHEKEPLPDVSNQRRRMKRSIRIGRVQAADEKADSGKARETSKLRLKWRNRRSKPHKEDNNDK